MSRSISTYARVTLAAVVATAATLTGTTAASAHAQLVSLTPVDGAQLTKAPASATITFNEGVTVTAGALQLLDVTGKVLAKSPAPAATPNVTVKFPTLKPGRYVLRWHVVSADGHPETAASAFAVKTPTVAAKPITVTLTDATNPSAPPVKLTVSGAKPGVRTVSVPLAASEGTIEWKSATFGAPLTWSLTPGNPITARGLIPTAGTWQVTVRARTSQFDERILTGTVRIPR